MQTATKQLMTVPEYLEFERASDAKHEFLDGEVFSMAGGTEMHSLLAGNLIRELGNRLKGRPCRVHTSDLRLKIEATGYHAYPDVQVVCGGARFADDHRDVLLNPRLIIEVLSPSTSSWDRGGKFWHYRHVPSFEEYILVSQDAWLIEHHTRQPNGGWLLETVSGPDGFLRLSSIATEIPLTDIYGGTNLPPSAITSAQPKNS